jgi:hypothetical protein
MISRLIFHISKWSDTILQQSPDSKTLVAFTLSGQLPLQFLTYESVMNESDLKAKVT